MMPLLGKLSGKKERSPSTSLPQRPSTASAAPGLVLSNNNSSTDLVNGHARVQSLDLAADGVTGGGGVGDKRLVAGLISGMPVAVPGTARTPVGEGSLTLEQLGQGGDTTTTFGPSPGKLSVAVPRAPELIVEVATPSSLSSTPEPGRSRTLSNNSLASPADRSRSGSTSRGLSPSRRPANIRQLSASEYGTAATQPSAGLGLHGQSYSEFGAGSLDEGTSPSQPSSRRTSAVNGASRAEFAASASTGNLASYSMSSSSSSLPHSTSAPHNLSVGGTPRRQSSISTGNADDAHGVYAQQQTMSPEASPPTAIGHTLPSKQMSLASVTSLGSRKNRSNTGNTQASIGGIAGAIAMSGVSLAAHSSQPVLAGVVNGAARSSVSRQASRSDMAADESRDAQRHGRLPSEDQSFDDGSEYGYSGRGSYDGFTSGIGLGSLDDVSSLLGTGYAVASSKRNAEFHQLFKQVPEDDYLIEDYGCALQREILIQGRLYISEHHLCFHANILGWVTTLVVPFSEVLRYEKRMTALIIPNAIQISTMHARHTFASFLSRDTTYDLIANIWRHTHPDVPASAALPDTASAMGGETDDDGPGLSADENIGQQTPSKKKKEKKSKKDKEKEKADKKTAAAAAAANAPQGSSSTGAEQSATVDQPDKPSKSKKKSKAAPHCETSAPIEKEFEDISIVCVDTVFPSTPEKIYNLMFTSGFMKTFWVENQKLTELEIGDWSPKAASHLLTRHMSYIKPLTAPVGPKSTKCKITDENHHVDFDDYIVTISTTQTPDVPSGNAFSVKTRTALTWTKNNHTRVYITTAVRWTGRSFLKGVINSSAIDGQKTYYSELEKAMRAYIQQHRSEFTTADDIDDDECDEVSSSDDAPKAVEGQPAHSNSAGDAGAKAGSPTTAEKAWWEDFVGSTAAGIIRPVVDIGAGVLDSILEASTGQLALGLIILVLLVSNIVMLRGSSDVTVRPTERGRYERYETDYVGRSPRRPLTPGGDNIALAVRGALDDWLDSQTRTGRLHHMPNGFGGNRNDRQDVPADAAVELDAISQSIDVLEERLAALKESLNRQRAAQARASSLPS